MFAVKFSYMTSSSSVQLFFTIHQDENTNKKSKTLTTNTKTSVLYPAAQNSTFCPFPEMYKLNWWKEKVSKEENLLEMLVETFVTGQRKVSEEPWVEILSMKWKYHVYFFPSYFWLHVPTFIHVSTTYECLHLNVVYLYSHYFSCSTFFPSRTQNL